MYSQFTDALETKIEDITKFKKNNAYKILNFRWKIADEK